MSPIGSYVGGLTSKGQVGVLLGEHRGWIMRMAALIKGRLSDNQTSDRKPVGLSFRIKDRYENRELRFESGCGKFL